MKKNNTKAILEITKKVIKLKLGRGTEQTKKQIQKLQQEIDNLQNQ